MLEKIDHKITESFRSSKHFLLRGLYGITPSWNHLYRIGKSKLVKASYLWIILIPIVAKFIPLYELTIHELCRIIQQFNFQCDPHHDFRLPFSWTCFYFGSISFAVSGLLYNTFCPFLNIKYQNPSQAISDNFTVEKLDSYFNDKTKQYSKDDKQIMLYYSKKDEDFDNRFWQALTVFKVKKFIPRVFCSTGYYLGFALYFIVLYQNLKFVISQM